MGFVILIKSRQSWHGGGHISPRPYFFLSYCIELEFGRNEIGDEMQGGAGSLWLEAPNLVYGPTRISTSALVDSSDRHQ